MEMGRPDGNRNGPSNSAKPSSRSSKKNASPQISAEFNRVEHVDEQLRKLLRKRNERDASGIAWAHTGKPEYVCALRNDEAAAIRAEFLAFLTIQQGYPIASAINRIRVVCSWIDHETARDIAERASHRRKGWICRANEIFGITKFEIEQFGIRGLSAVDMSETDRAEYARRQSAARSERYRMKNNCKRRAHQHAALGTQKVLGISDWQWRKIPKPMKECIAAPLILFANNTISREAAEGQARSIYRIWRESQAAETRHAHSLDKEINIARDENRLSHDEGALSSAPPPSPEIPQHPLTQAQKDMPMKQCKVCNRPVPPGRKKYCSERCADKAQIEQYREWRVANPEKVREFNRYHYQKQVESKLRRAH